MVPLKHEIITLVEWGIGTRHSANLISNTNKLLERVVVAEYLQELGCYDVALAYLLESKKREKLYAILSTQYRFHGGLPPVVDEVFDELRKEFASV